MHGDDFTALGPRDALLWYDAQLANVSELTLKGRLGVAPDCDKEVWVLNRIVRIGDDGISYEADPRHVKHLIQAGGLELGDPQSPPGVKTTDRL